MLNFAFIVTKLPFAAITAWLIYRVVMTNKILITGVGMSARIPMLWNSLHISYVCCKSPHDPSPSLWRSEKTENRGKRGFLLTQADIPEAYSFYMGLCINNTDWHAQDTLKESQSVCVATVLAMKRTSENWQTLWQSIHPCILVYSVHIWIFGKIQEVWFLQQYKKLQRQKESSP